MNKLTNHSKKTFIEKKIGHNSQVYYTIGTIHYTIYLYIYIIHTIHYIQIFIYIQHNTIQYNTYIYIHTTDFKEIAKIY